MIHFSYLCIKPVLSRSFFYEKDSKYCEIMQLKKKVLYTKNSWPNFTFIYLRGNEQIIYNIFLQNHNS
jgi:hypothetical protein